MVHTLIASYSRRHGTVSLSRSFPRSFAGKLQIGDFHGSVDLRIRAIFPSAWTYFNLSAIRSWDRVQRPTLMHAVSNALWYVYQETPGGTDMSWRNLIAQSGAAQPVCLSVFRDLFPFSRILESFDRVFSQELRDWSSFTTFTPPANLSVANCFARLVNFDKILCTARFFNY